MRTITLTKPQVSPEFLNELALFLPKKNVTGFSPKTLIDVTYRLFGEFVARRWVGEVK